MATIIKKEDIQYIAELARINLQGEEDRLLKDAEAIFSYFEELTQVDTDGISPMAGATNMVNIASADDVNEELVQKGIESFPESVKGCLKVPGVMRDIKQNG